MKRFLILIVLAALLAPAPAMAAVTENISPAKAFSLLGQTEQVFLLDVRTTEEYRQARLEGARLIPINQLVNRIDELPKDRPIVVYCAVGSRSAQVVSYLARRGYPELYNLYGGIYSWAQKGFPVLKGGP